MSSLFKPFGRTKWRFEHRGKTYHTGTANKTAASQIMRDTVSRIEKELAGIPIAAQERRRAPIADLITAWQADLVRRARGPRYTKDAPVIVARIFTACSWTNLSETLARLDQLATYMSQLATNGRAGKTQNVHRTCLHTFLKFCTYQRWLEAVPTLCRPAPATKVYLRRAFTDQEFASLLTSPFATIYYTAALSGFRRIELSRLTKQDLDPTAPIPYWSPRPKVTAKSRGRRDTMPIHHDLLPVILGIWQKLPNANAPLFPDPPTDTDFHRDLKAAGIVNPDQDGKHADFHSFRYYFCKLMAKSLRIQKVQKLMRHSTITLTADLYNELGLSDLADEPLPSCPVPLQKQTLPLSLPQEQKPQDFQGFSVGAG